ncbi:MAG: hypothetical protein L6455_14600 [Kiritimatiellae bacterium]|nr:hypothetical protein [Kiritimatiellia bacterium]
MTISISNLDSDLDYAIADLPTALTITGLTTGASVNSVATEINSGETLQMAGMMPDISIQFFVPTAAFTTRPARGQTCTAGGVTFRIQNIRTSPDDVALTLECTEDES